MAACGSLQRMFEKPFPENPTLLESLSSWNQIKPVQPVEQPAFTEIFGELHFKETTPQQASSPALSFPISSSLASYPSSSSTDLAPQQHDRNNIDGSSDDKRCEHKRSKSLDSFPGISKTQYARCHRNGGHSFSLMNYESLQLCTEGLGFESSDDVEDLKNEMNEDWQSKEEKTILRSTSERHHSTAATENYNPAGEFRRSRSFGGGGAFPPPISCIGKSGKPWVCFKSYRQDGRFVLKEVRIPTREFLHAHREDGRLKLHFVQPNEEIIKEDEEGNCEDDDDDDGNEEQQGNEDAGSNDDDDDEM